MGVGGEMWAGVRRIDAQAGDAKHGLGHVGDGGVAHCLKKEHMGAGGIDAGGGSTGGV